MGSTPRWDSTSGFWHLGWRGVWCHRDSAFGLGCLRPAPTPGCESFLPARGGGSAPGKAPGLIKSFLS